VNVTQSTIAQIGDGYGLAEGGCSVGAGYAVVSGRDFRRQDEPYINQLFVSLSGGPGGPRADGWASYAGPQSPGSSYRDSIELDEIKHPILFKSLRMQGGTGGAGRMRGSPASEVVFGPRQDAFTAVVTSDCNFNRPKGVRGGQDGQLAMTYKISEDGSETLLGNVIQLDVKPGEWLRGRECSGGGYGDPRERDPARVLYDVLEGWETIERAASIYAVAFTGAIDDESLAVDAAATARLRAGSA
jgi:N-methylhydantoinase B